MPDNKKHHYVPLFYLRRFSSDGKNIRLWNIPTQKKVPSAPIKTQCYENYFYGEDPDVEKALAFTEERIASVLRHIDQSGTPPEFLSEKHIMLILFVLLQHSRTKFMHDNTNQQVDRLHKIILRDHPKTEGINIENFKITMKNAVTLPIKIAISLYPIMLDLKYKLLRNQTEIEFVTSDNPTVKYNQLYERLPQNKKFGGFSGLSTKGLQIFMPICPDKLLFFYDPRAYSVFPKNRSVVDVSNPQDIYQINALQFCSAVENLYFRNDDFEAEGLHKKASRFRKSNDAKFFEFPVNVTDVPTEQIIGFSYPDIITNLHLSFVKISKPHKIWLKNSTQKQDKIYAEIRSQELHDDTQRISKKIERGEHNVTDFQNIVNKYKKN